jgi:hypothetical protein
MVSSDLPIFGITSSIILYSQKSNNNSNGEKVTKKTGVKSVTADEIRIQI